MATSTCELYLVFPVGAADGPARLAALLSSARVACVLLTPTTEEAWRPETLRPLVKAAQRADVAVVLEDDYELAKAVGADGVHLADDPFDYDAARAHLGPKAIVGVGVGTSRHDAMVLGEKGADYVAFEGEADDEEAEAVRPGQEAGDDEGDLDDDTQGGWDRDGLIAWWSELFTVPCVALGVASLEEAEDAADLGADFVALAPAAWQRASDPGAAVAAFARCLAGDATER